ncbi:MAG: A24 family peptidase [bacterium]
MVSCLLEVIFIYDLKHYIIPDSLVFSAIIIVLLFNILNLFVNCKLKIENCDSLLNSIIAIVVSAGFFFLIWLVSRGRWMGFGDVKLALFMGLFLGWPNILIALFFAFISGSVIGLILIALQKKKMKSQVPFGPFLIAGTFVGLFWGEKIISWYLNLIY